MVCIWQTLGSLVPQISLLHSLVTSQPPAIGNIRTVSKRNVLNKGTLRYQSQERRSWPRGKHNRLALDWPLAGLVLG